MSNNMALKDEIKRELKILNVKSVLLLMLALLPAVGAGMIFGAFVILGYPILQYPIPLLFLMSTSWIMCSLVAGVIIGLVVGGTIGRHYQRQALRLSKTPEEIEIVKNGLIALGAFVTTIENTVNAKHIAKIFRNIARQLARITPLENDVKTLKEDVNEIKKEFMPEFQKARQEYENEKMSRIKAENERDKTAISLNEVLSENFKLKEENKKLKGE
ncbi:MAG: hypothetical protein ACYDAJ_11725 [Nitrosotalea sp.]